MNTVTQTARTEARNPDDTATLLPPVDVIEDASGITLLADLPGVPRENLHLRVEGDQLSIEADARLDVPAGLASTYAEVRSARYRRAFTLSKELDAERVDAELANGQLPLRIPKAPPATPRRIAVNVG